MEVTTRPLAQYVRPERVEPLLPAGTVVRGRRGFDRLSPNGIGMRKGASPAGYIRAISRWVIVDWEMIWIVREVSGAALLAKNAPVRASATARCEVIRP